MAEYSLNRLVSFFPTLFIVSILVFIIINAPPGDYLTVLANELRQTGDAAAEYELGILEQRYGLNQPIHVRYWKWITNFVKGDLGESFEWRKPVSEVIGDRLLLTLILSGSTMFFTWLISIPIGVYTAIHKDSLSDRVLTIVGFLGLATPNFLLALVALYLSAVHFQVIGVGGLFSEEFASAPWSVAKAIDLVKHMIIPILVIGTSQMAELIRIMRSNMLDILGQPYVLTNRAKGLKGHVIVYKHCLRVAINPLISMAGMQLPNLISGTMIVAIVLNLPTVGPMLRRALVSQDVYLSGSFLMIVTALLLVGNLLADVALALADPRIRYN